MSKQNDGKVVHLAGLKVSCNECRLNELCLPLGLHRDEIGKLDRVVQKSPTFDKGSYLFSAGDEAEAIYVARTGAVKTLYTNPDGAQTIVGFHLPGELIGLDGVADGSHHVTAETLTSTSVCRLPLKDLQAVARQVPSLHWQLSRLISREFLQTEQHLLLLSEHAADKRLAILLVSLSRRYAALGFSATEFNLPMSRLDMATYLGLAGETVSRLFTSFKESGLIGGSGRLVVLQDLPAMETLAGLEASSCSPRRRDKA